MRQAFRRPYGLKGFGQGARTDLSSYDAKLEEVDPDVEKLSMGTFADKAGVSESTALRDFHTWELAAADGHVPPTSELDPTIEPPLPDDPNEELWRRYYHRTMKKVSTAPTEASENDQGRSASSSPAAQSEEVTVASLPIPAGSKPAPPAGKSPRLSAEQVKSMWRYRVKKMDEVRVGHGRVVLLVDGDDEWVVADERPEPEWLRPKETTKAFMTSRSRADERRDIRLSRPRSRAGGRLSPEAMEWAAVLREYRAVGDPNDDKTLQLGVRVRDDGVEIWRQRDKVEEDGWWRVATVEACEPVFVEPTFHGSAWVTADQMEEELKLFRDVVLCSPYEVLDVVEIAFEAAKSGHLMWAYAGLTAALATVSE